MPGHRDDPREAWSFALGAAITWFLGLASVVTLVVIAVLVWQRMDEPLRAPDSREPSVAGTSATASAKPEPEPTSNQDPPEIVLEQPPAALAWPAKVPVIGRFPTAEPGSSVRIQLLEADGSWMTFPLPIDVDDSGRFVTYVELGRRGANHLRVTDPGSGATSNVVIVGVQ